MINRNNKVKITHDAIFKTLLYIGSSLLCFYAGIALAAADSGTIGGVASHIVSSFKNVAKLIVATAYIAGFGFAVAAILKFKAHKDNPTQIPIGTPIALLFVAIALLFLPSVLKIGGKTVFSSGKVGGISGSGYTVVSGK